MVIFTLILALAFAILAVIFALENAVMVTMSFFGTEVEGSLALFILLAVLLGVIIGILVMMPGTVRHSLELRSNRKRIGDLEKSLNEQKGQIAKAEKIEPLTDFPEDDKV
ncbi:MAG TPA: LapA family protein [Anaerolineales bacterium]